MFCNQNIFYTFFRISSFNLPFISWVLVAVLLIILAVGLRYFFIILLINEFCKHARGQNIAGNNEVLNVLLRAPDLDELVWWWFAINIILKNLKILFLFQKYYQGCRIKADDGE